MAVLLLASSALIFSTGGLFIRELDHPHAWQTVFWRSFAACISLALLIIWRERSNPIRAVVQHRSAGLGRRRRLLRVIDRDGGRAHQDQRCGRSRDLCAQPTCCRCDGVDPDRRAGAQLHMDGDRRDRRRRCLHGLGTGAGGSTSGALIALVIPLAFGYGTVMIRRHAEIAMAPAMLLSAAISSVVSLPFAHPFDITRHDLLLLLAFGFAQLGIGLTLFSIGAARAPATDVALLSMLEPIMGPIWVWIFVSEYPGVPALIGGSAVFVALAAHTVYAASRTGTDNRATRRVWLRRQPEPLLELADLTRCRPG